jgi:chromosome transmission fidelity protein 1
VKFPPAILPEEQKMDEDSQIEDLKHLTLGSRRNLCINPSVNKLTSITAINERCLELQQPSTERDHKCAFLPNKDNQPLVNDFRDHALATIRDIEDMGALGKELGICPYYASRSTIKPAEIVTLPYPLLLQKSAREALKLNLTGHVVIIDEAHNLMDAIAGIEGVEVSLSQLKRARTQLGGYLQKFRNRLKGKNRVYVAQVVRVIDSLAGYLESRLKLPVWCSVSGSHRTG